MAVSRRDVVALAPEMVRNGDDRGRRGRYARGKSPPTASTSTRKWEAALAVAGVVLASVACARFGYSIGDRLYDLVSDSRAQRASKMIDAAGLSGERRLTAEKMELDMERYPHARCLDGTPGAYYVNLATSKMSRRDAKNVKGDASALVEDERGSEGYATARTWVIMLQGGGECVAAPGCAERAGTARGSSELLPDEIVYDRGIQAVASDDVGKSLPFSNANMVTVAYCSGDLYMGRAQEADATGMWHSGSYIVEAVLQELIRAYGMTDADVILLAGRSAGGIGLVAQVDAWADLIRERLPAEAKSSVKIVGAPFAGYHFFHNETTFIDKSADAKEKAGVTRRGDDALNYIPWDEDSFKRYIEYWRAQESLPEACVMTHAGEEWRCIVAAHSFKTIRTPLFFSQALTDSVVMRLHDNFGGDLAKRKQLKFAVKWSKTMRRVLAPVLKHPSAGLFAAQCYMHTDFDDVSIDGVSHQTAFAEWVFHEKTVRLVDACDGVSCNPTCKSFKFSNPLDLDGGGNSAVEDDRDEEEELASQKKKSLVANRRTESSRASASASASAASASASAAADIGSRAVDATTARRDARRDARRLDRITARRTAARARHDTPHAAADATPARPRHDM